MPHQGDIIIDFRCNALGAWDTGMHGCGGYRILYSNIRVLSTVADFQQPMVSPGPKPGRLPGKDLCVRIAEEILESPNAPVRGRGFKTKLADAVLERLHAQGISLFAIERRTLSSGVGGRLTKADKPDNHPGNIRFANKGCRTAFNRCHVHLFASADIWTNRKSPLGTIS